MGFNYTTLYAPNEFMNGGLYIGHQGQFKNFHELELWAYIEPYESKDFFEPRVAGKVYTGQSRVNIGIEHETDDRKNVILEWEISYRMFNGVSRNQLVLNLNPKLNITDKLSVEYNVTVENANNDEGVAIDNDGYNTIVNDTIIFGKRDQKTLINVVNINYIFTNKMGLTFRARHYWSRVEYNSFHALSEAGYLEASNFTGLNADGESLYNFSYNAFNIDLYYRWRFAPGSELSIVWKASIDNEDNIIDRTYFKNLDQTLNSPQFNSFSIKFLYYLDAQYLKKKG